MQVSVVTTNGSETVYVMVDRVEESETKVTLLGDAGNVVAEFNRADVRELTSV